jgi:cytoplasmic iron level regulating protein YaaA (DUF328/UPF0246 family)
MLILLSPAKTLDMQPPASSASTSTSAGCADAADELVGELQKLSVPQLKALLGVSDALARCVSTTKRARRADAHGVLHKKARPTRGRPGMQAEPWAVQRVGQPA